MIGSLPVKVGLGISLADHIEKSGEIYVTTLAGNPRELVGEQPVHWIQLSISASATIVIVWLWSSAPFDRSAGAISPYE